MKTFLTFDGSRWMRKLMLSAMLVTMGHSFVGAFVLAFLSGANKSSV